MSDHPHNRSTVHHERVDDAPSPDAIAEHFPQLEIIRIVGRGGMGIVYQARQRSLDRMVALKVLPPDETRPESFQERFSREARALARLQHPNIVNIHDSGKAGEYFFFIMEFVDGANLRHMMDTNALSPAEALAVVSQICDALQYAHEEGIAHRDIKPENILIDTRGRVRIADFGLAKLLANPHTDLALTMPHHILGTMHYMAPEQIERSDQVDHRADIYALGVVLYELLTGELPLGRFPLPSQRLHPDRHNLGETPLDSVVLRALAKEPDNRYQSVSEVKTDLEYASSADDALHGPAGMAYVPPATPMRPASLGLGDFLNAPKSVGIAYICWLACLVGIFGLHRMYLGKWITGIVWLATFGCFFIGQFVDLFLMSEMTDRANWQQQIHRERMSSGERSSYGSHGR